MPLLEPRTPAGRAGLAAVLAEPARAVIALDFDGTLAPIVLDPAAARITPQAREGLAALGRVVGALLVVTGRPAQVAVDLGGFAGAAAFPRLVVLGQYGAERWDAATGVVSSPPPHDGVQAARERLTSVLAEVGAPVGTAVEDKGAAIAVHVRQTANPDEAFALLSEPITKLAHDSGLELVPGRLVLEMRPAGRDKGDALREFVLGQEARSVLFAGDDLGDLPAFDAIERLRTEGVAGLTVASESEEAPEVAARADLVVAGPDGIVQLLVALAAAIGNG